jgi:hypothetical protein
MFLKSLFADLLWRSGVAHPHLFYAEPGLEFESTILKKVWIVNPRAQKVTFCQKVCEIILDLCRIFFFLTLGKV